MERARRADASAFTELVRRHAGSLLRLARVFVRDSNLAEEVVHETWIAVLEGLDRFEGRAAFRSWLFAICGNKARTRGAREARVVPFSSLARVECALPAEDVLEGRFDGTGHWAPSPDAWEEDTPEALLLRSETRQVLERAVLGLSEAQRTVLTMRDLEGLSSEEACNVLGIEENHQRVLLHRARTKVRAALEKHRQGGG